MNERDEIIDNIDGYIQAPVRGLVLFGDEVIEKSAGVIRDLVLQSPTVPSPESLLLWFSSFPSVQLEEARSSWQTETFSGEANLFLTRSAKLDPSSKIAWPDVRAIGYLSSGDSINYQHGLLRAYAR